MAEGGTLGERPKDKDILSCSCYTECDCAKRSDCTCFTCQCFGCKKGIHACPCQPDCGCAEGKECKCAVSMCSCVGCPNATTKIRCLCCDQDDCICPNGQCECPGCLKRVKEACNLLDTLCKNPLESDRQ